MSLINALKIALKLNPSCSKKEVSSVAIKVSITRPGILAKHSGMDLEVFCDGDIFVDYHHTVEDVGIVLGEALYKEVYPIENIERFANATAILDEAAVEVDLDIGG